VAEVALRPVGDSDLDALFEQVRASPEAPVRPVFARAASDNLCSLKVLRKAGFAITGTEISFANGRKAEIEETILRLGGPANTGTGS
jgi:L-amino acid N-acyltransferase YncA